MYSSKLPPRTSGLPPKKSSQSRVQARAKLTGPLIYGEEAMRTLRSYQPQPNSKQMFRQDRGGRNIGPMPVNAKPTTPQRMITEFQMRTPPPTGQYHIPRMHDLGLGSRPPIERSPHESFAEFTRRVNTLTSNKFDLDQNLHDRFVELSLGQRPQNSAFDYGPGSRQNTRGPTAVSMAVATPMSYGRLIPRVDTANEDGFRSVKPYETTFALHEARSSGSESDSFHPSDRYWRNTMNKQKFRGSKEVRQAKKTLIPPSLISQRYRGMGSRLGNQTPNLESERSSGMYKSNIVEEGQLILRQASKLLSESSKLRMREEEDPEVRVKSRATNLGYVPLKVKGLNKNPKVTFYDKIQERRESIKSNGYIPVDPLVEEIREMWKDGEKGVYPVPITDEKISEKVGENRSAFGGKKLSSLVAKHVTALQGRGLSLNESDDMNPIERKLLEGLENYELSYFLPGPGHKSPRPSDPPRPLLKKEKNSLGLTPGIGQTSLFDSQEVRSLGRGRPGMGESKITKYLEELRLSGYPDKLPAKLRAEKRRQAAKFMENADDYEFDESILNNFNMSPERREEFIEGMKERRLQRIRAKAGAGGNKFVNPNSYVSRVMGGMHGKF